MPRDRSSRIEAKLTSTSTTPRSGRRFVEELAKANSYKPHEQLYEEGKLALTNGEVEVSLFLFQQCPPSYKHTARYISQCNLYQKMREKGVLSTGRSIDLRILLSSLFSEKGSSLPVATCAEDLHQKGYTAETIKGMDMWEGQHLLSSLSIQEGYKRTLRSHFLSNSGLFTNLFFRFEDAGKKCSFRDAEKCISLLTKKKD